MQKSKTGHKETKTETDTVMSHGLPRRACCHKWYGGNFVELEAAQKEKECFQSDDDMWYMKERIKTKSAETKDTVDGTMKWSSKDITELSKLSAQLTPDIEEATSVGIRCWDVIEIEEGESQELQRGPQEATEEDFALLQERSDPNKNRLIGFSWNRFCYSC